MATLTAVVHTKNSAKTLDACLSSLAFCDEIVVVDMESVDDTLKIAKKHKTTIYHEQSSERFADPIRDQYLRKVKTDWTLIVDSDEEVPPSFAAKIRELISTGTADGYSLPRKNIIFGKWIEHTGFWPDHILRLFRTGKGTYPPFVHSQPTVDGTVVTLDANPDHALIHHHYDSVEQFLLRLNVYTSLEADKIKAKRGEATAVAGNFVQAFFDQFFTRFFAQQGYKDGRHGLVLSLLMAVYMMVVQMKVWEQTAKESKTQETAALLDEVEQTINDGCRGTMYWVANEKLSSPANIVDKLKHQIRRKLTS